MKAAVLLNTGIGGVLMGAFASLLTNATSVAAEAPKAVSGVSPAAAALGTVAGLFFGRVYWMQSQEIKRLQEHQIRMELKIEELERKSVEEVDRERTQRRDVEDELRLEKNKAALLEQKVLVLEEAKVGLEIGLRKERDTRLEMERQLRETKDRLLDADGLANQHRQVIKELTEKTESDHQYGRRKEDEH